MLGLASAEESAEFEQMCSAHPEVLNARNDFESQLETTLTTQKIAPPPELKTRIFSEIGMEKPEKKETAPFRKPALIPRVGFAKYVAAASLVFLAASVLLNLYLLDQYKKSIAQYKDLLATQTAVTDANQLLQTRLQSYENSLQIISDPLMEIIKMPGVPSSPAPSSLTTVYYNTASNDVYLLVNQLPQPAKEQQYQLWAIVDGKPVDAGIFEIKSTDSAVVKMKSIAHAQAFAITLEKRGGSLSPTMHAMYVMGKVSS